MQKKNYKKIFGARLEQIREQKGLSRHGLAKKSGLADSQIKRIAEGIITPKLDTIMILAEALEVEPKEMLDFSELD